MLEILDDSNISNPYRRELAGNEPSIGRFKLPSKRPFAKVPTLSLFFPVYNEEANVETMILHAQAVLPLVAEEWEIIPINDGSTDSTGQIIDRLASEDPCIRPIHHRRNLGYGSAIISGYNAAQHDVIFFTDGDLQFDLGEITKLTEKLASGDLILGYRTNRTESLLRKLNAFLWGQLVKFLFDFQVKDVDCAFKMIKRTVIDKVDLTASGAMVSTELLAKAKRGNFRFIEVAITHYPRKAGKATGSNLPVILKAFKELCRLYPILKRSP